ncbi:hypothetical protein [Deinococcus sp.]|uniref:hypothetical protein n=1 Tax=Deinococcus sp. TaxID=47478 RepID=UPI0025F8B259|nr:hypothetical protein [Deinococcus sp.]
MTVVRMQGLGALTERGLLGAATDFGKACTGAFDDPLWNWPHTTRRRNGETVSSPRNLVDSGDLRDSLMPPEQAGNAVRLTWTSDHAGEVFLGAPGKPGRNLPEYVARSFNFPAAFLHHAGLL